MADELRQDESSPTIAALCWPARSRADGCLVIPGRRSARGRRARHAECRLVLLRDGCHRIPRAGFRDCSLRSPEHRKGRSAR